MRSSADPFARADEAAGRLAELTGIADHGVALVLGSGWGPAVDAIGATVAEVPTSELPGFPEATVPGHGGAIRSLDADGVPVLAFLGR
ncbi:MAG: purine-nucleoside phosphorylase, partial [Actinomycetota bacterium]